MNRSALNLELGCFLIILFLLVGCSTIPRIEFDKMGNSHINKMALLQVDEPQDVKIIGSAPKSVLRPLGCMSCLGMCLAFPTVAAYDSANSKTFRQELNNHHIQFSPAMVEALRQELTENGYEVIYLQDQLSVSDGGNETGYYSQIETDADAIMTVIIKRVGYIRGSWGVYTPSVLVFTHLFDLRTKREIYSRVFWVDEAAKHDIQKSIEKMLPVYKYRYDSLDTLMKNINEAAQGIIDCQNEIAARIAEQLKQKNTYSTVQLTKP